MDIPIIDEFRDVELGVNDLTSENKKFNTVINNNCNNNKKYYFWGVLNYIMYENMISKSISEYVNKKKLNYDKNNLKRPPI